MSVGTVIAGMSAVKSPKVNACAMLIIALMLPMSASSTAASITSLLAVWVAPGVDVVNLP